MKRTRFTEEQIIGELKDAGAGANTAELGRRRELESENARLERLLAVAMLDQAALMDLL